MSDQLSTTFAALADPTRRAILSRLASGECSVTELAEPFEMSMPAVSKHLRVLERAGLIARGRLRLLRYAVAAFGFLIYTIVAEWKSGQTFGKRRYGLFVVQESGAPITLGQSVVRQLSLVFQIFWIDALFTLFTERRQRAFELLSKTRVVRADDQQG